jgi:FkbM family methyltransferase
MVGYRKRYQIKRGDVVVDAGAFVGDFTYYAAKTVGPTGKVLVFEPDEGHCFKIEEGLRAAGLTNVIVIRKGLWREDAVLKFKHNADEPAESAFVPESDADENVTRLPVAALDSELARRGIQRVDFIKMDIEGAEIEAIHGMRTTLRDQFVHLAIASYHVIDGKQTCHEIERLLRTLGYEAETANPPHLTTYGRKLA